MKIEDIKTGMTDASTMIKDRNFKPFLRPFVVLLVVVIVAWSLYKGTSDQIIGMKKKAEAQAVEVENREDYLKSKAKYKKLTEELPPNTQKSFWHQTELISIMEKVGLPKDSWSKGNEIQNSDGVFTISTIPVKGDITFDQLGRLMETIENSPTFMRVSDLRISRKQGETTEKLNVTFNTNTVFIQDKDFPTFVGGKNEK